MQYNAWEVEGENNDQSSDFNDYAEHNAGRDVMSTPRIANPAERQLWAGG